MSSSRFSLWGMDALPSVTNPATVNMGNIAPISVGGDQLSPLTTSFSPDFLASVNTRPPTFGEQFSGLFDGMLGSTKNGIKTDGWGGLALGAAEGLFNGWLGMQKMGLAKDQLAQSKKAFQMNYDAQAKTTNARLEDQQRARVAANPGAYQSVDSYMKQYRIGG